MQYAEVHITKSKTKPRTLPLIFSIPYVKDWLDSHPFTNNPDAFLFISLADNNFGNRLTEQAVYKLYTEKYKKISFPKLIDNDSNIPERDKTYIRNLLTKPWTPYIQRHSALTAKSLILKEHTLRDYAGWSMSSKMPQVYIHYFGNESSKSLLEAYGIEDYSNINGKTNLLKSKPCPNCDEPNKPEAKFCFKCKMILTFDSYKETLEIQKEKDEKISVLEKQINDLTEAEKNKTDFTKEEMEYLRNIIMMFGRNIGPEAHEYAKKYGQCHFSDEGLFDGSNKWDDLCDMERNFFEKNIRPTLKKYPSD